VDLFILLPFILLIGICAWFVVPLLALWRGFNSVEGATEQLTERLKPSLWRLQLDRLQDMNGKEFEHYMASVFEALGHHVTVMGGSGDQGVDLLMWVEGVLVAVQCKHHQRPVNNKAVQEVRAGKDHYGAAQAWVVAPKGYTKGAVALAETNDVRLYDYSDIVAWVVRAEERSRNSP
jgi:restriction system protein